MSAPILCSSYTISGLMPGDAEAAARHPLAERLAALHRAGYRGLWLHWRDYAEWRAAGRSDGDLRAGFEAHGMEAGGVEFLADWFVDAPGARAAEQAAFAAAGAVGATLVNVGGDLAGRGIDWRDMLAPFDALCGRAAERGLRVALEFVPWSNVPDIETALAFLGPDNAGLVVDSWHLFRGGMGPSELERLPADRVWCIQVNDADAAPVGPLSKDTLRRKPCGDGAFDLAGFLSTLARIGVEAPVSVEIISPGLAAMPVDQAASVSIAGARRLVHAHYASAGGA